MRRLEPGVDGGGGWGRHGATAVAGGEGKREGVGAGVETSRLQRVHPHPPRVGGTQSSN